MHWPKPKPPVVVNASDLPTATDKLDKILAWLGKIDENQERMEHRIMAKVEDLQAAIDAEDVEITHLSGVATDEAAAVEEVIRLVNLKSGGTLDTGTADKMVEALQKHLNNLQTIERAIAVAAADAKTATASSTSTTDTTTGTTGGSTTGTTTTTGAGTTVQGTGTGTGISGAGTTGSAS